MIDWKDPAPFVVSTIITFGLFVILGLLIFRSTPLDPQIADVIKVILGGLITAQVTVVNYWVGSSAGSRAKDETISKMATEK